MEKYTKFGNSFARLPKVKVRVIQEKKSFQKLLMTSVIGLAGLFLFILFSKPAAALTFPLPSPGVDMVGQIRVVYSEPGEDMHSIARRYDLGYDELLSANPQLENKKIKPWTKIVLPTSFILPPGPRLGVVINLAELRLYYYRPNQNVVETYPLAIGRDGWETPTVETEIVKKIKDPAWHVPKSIQAESASKGIFLPDIVPPGPKNPLGKYAFHLAIPGIRIHGTTAPYSIGTRSSHGCMRMYPEDVENLYNQMEVPMAIRIINEPYKTGWDDGKLYLEALKPFKDSAVPNLAQVIEKNEKSSAFVNVDWREVKQVIQEKSGIPRIIGGAINQFN